MPIRSVGFRLETDGKAQVKNDFAEVQAAATTAMDAFGDAAERAADRASKATSDYTQRQLDAFAKQAQAAKLAAAQANVRSSIDDALGQTGNGSQFATVNLDRTTSKEYQQRAADLRAAFGVEEEGATKLTSALSLNRTQMIIAQSAVMRFTDSIIAGASPVRAFALEAHKLGEVVSFDDGGVAGGMNKLRALLNPTTIAIGATATAVAVGTVAWIEYSSAVAKLNAAALGAGAALGLSGTQLQQNAEAAAAAGNLTVSAAREIEAGYLGIAKSGDALMAMTAVTHDFAAATGQDLTAAAGALGKAFDDPIEGAQELAAKYGLISQAQAEHIAKLVEQGQQSAAQTELANALAAVTKGAAERAEGLASGWGHVASQISQAWTQLGKYVDTYQRLSSGTFFNSAPNGASPVNANANEARQRAANVVASYQGDGRDTIRRNIGILQAGVKAGGSDVDDYSNALSANQRALETWVPAQQKANDVAAAQAKLSAARSPAAKAAATEALVLAQNEGVVITKADLLAQAHSRAEGAAAKATHTGDRHAATLAREAESMEVAAKQSLVLADAYLQGSAQGLEQEARRKAATDATKKGIDVEAEARRQLNLQVAQAIATGAKSVAGMRDETAGRQAVLDQVAGGTLSVDDMSRALSDEAALRPLITLRTIAQGSALTALEKVIVQYRAALTDAHTAEDRMGFEKAMQDSIDRAQELKASIVDLAHTPLDRALNAAQRAASQQADTMHLPLDSKDRSTFVNQKVAEAQAQYDANRAKFMVDFVQDQQDSIALTQRELDLAGVGDDKRTLALDQLRQEQLIRRQFPDLSEAEVHQRLALVALQDQLNAQLKVTSAAWSEIRDFGDKFADDVLNPDNWSSWGNIAKTVLKDIEGEFIKLVALNPLKNLINGNSALPTLGSLLGSLTGGGLASASDTAYLAGSSNTYLSNFSLGHNATGTDSWSGGMTWVNENGPEIADLPNGTRIYPAAETRRMMAANDRGVGEVHQHFYLDGAIVDSSLYQQMVAIGDNAAMRGATGGAALAQSQATKRARYRIPGR